MREGDRALKQLSKKCNFADVIVGEKGSFFFSRESFSRCTFYHGGRQKRYPEIRFNQLGEEAEIPVLMLFLLTEKREKEILFRLIRIAPKRPKPSPFLFSLHFLGSGYSV